MRVLGTRLDTRNAEFQANCASMEALWSEERSFPIRGGLGGSYAVLEFPIPAGLPPTEPPPLTGGLQHGRRYCRWALQAVAETDRAYRDELYAVIVQPAAGAVPARASNGDALPIEIDRNVGAAEPAATAAAAKAPAFEVSRRLVASGENAGAFENDIDAEFFPRKL